MITENLDASNKFIVNNLYNDDLILNGTLTINSNLIVLGDTTQLDTIVYTTERLEVVNANNTTTAFMVQQNTADRDIFVASNMNTAVFKIANNGDVGIGTMQPRSKLDVIGSMTISGDVVPGSNTVYNLGSPSRKWKDLYLSGNSIFLNNTVLSSDDGADLSIKDTTGSLKSMIINTIQVSGDVQIIGEGYYKKNDRDVIDDTSNYILASSNTLIRKANFNDANTSNYILSTSNNLINYVLASSNTLINKANFNDANTSNYILSTSNKLINYVNA
jgi:hypothetical protein